MPRRFTPLILLIAGMVLLVSGLIYQEFAQSIANPGPAPVPDSVAGLTRTRVVYGAEAVSEVSQLHRKTFPLSAAAAATYRGQSSSATLWVAGAPARLLASRLIKEMEAAIASTSSPFSPVGTRQLDGRVVYELSGLGQRHFYFRSAELVVWLAADEVVAEDALAATLDFYR